jgi:regulator of sigma E protease
LIGRWCGVKVDAFSLGFGPEIFGFDDRYATHWRLAALPFGGYVKFHGGANGASLMDQAAAAAMSPQEHKIIRGESYGMSNFEQIAARSSAT